MTVRIASYSLVVPLESGPLRRTLGTVNERRIGERAPRGTRLKGGGVAVVSLAVLCLVSLGFGASASIAGSFSGAYTGTFSGSASGEVEFTIAGTDVTVTKPGDGSGSISGSDITMVVGNAVVGGYSCQYNSTGQLSVNPSGEGVATGTWSATCAGGVGGNGTWQATRSAAPSPSPSASVSPTPSPTELGERTLSLKAKPKSLSQPGRTRLTATLSDCTDESSIDLQVKRDGVFRTVATLDPDDDCRASLRRRVTRRTKFRAQAPADELFLGARSRVVTVKLDRG